MFIPPHCPHPDCDNFDSPSHPLWFRKIGSYPTITFGSVPRFQCNSCHRTFSKQTFSIDYFAKRRLDYHYIAHQINAGAGIRNIARDLKVKDAAITNRINRLGRNATLINQQIVSLLPFKEDLVLDGLQNFCVSQFFPDNSTIIAGKDSQFVYDCDYATIRRGGRMTPDQKIKREVLEKTFKARPKSIEHSFVRLLRLIRKHREDGAVPLILYTDEKKDYERVLWKKAEFRDLMFEGRWRHHKTNSKEGRNRANPLFSVNYIDREIRKDMASQARETVQFPRNVSNGMLRMNLYLFDHNVYKPYRINDPVKREVSHAEEAGMEKEILKELTGGFSRQRYFKPKGLELSDSAEITLKRGWVTPLKKRPERLPKHLRV